MKKTAQLLILLLAQAELTLHGEDTIDYQALNQGVSIRGRLGIPLGHAVEIEAQVVLNLSAGEKDDVHNYRLKVTEIGTNVMANPPVCPFWDKSSSNQKLANDGLSLYELKMGHPVNGVLWTTELEELERDYIGRSYRLLVYETGCFQGIPRNLPKGYFVWQDRGFRFDTNLIVLQVSTNTSTSIGIGKSLAERHSHTTKSRTFDSTTGEVLKTEETQSIKPSSEELDPFAVKVSPKGNGEQGNEPRSNARW